MRFNPHVKETAVITGDQPQSVSARVSPDFTGFPTTLTKNERGALELRFPKRPDEKLARELQVRQWMWTDSRQCYMGADTPDNQAFVRNLLGLDDATEQSIVIPIKFAA
jgi:hypothetical protein